MLPKGTRIVTIVHYDNSPNNKFNPDPQKTVFWGLQNWDEMQSSFLGFLIPSDTECQPDAEGPPVRACCRARSRRRTHAEHGGSAEVVSGCRARPLDATSAPRALQRIAKVLPRVVPIAREHQAALVIDVIGEHAGDGESGEQRADEFGIGE